MTVTVETPSASALANGVTTVFPYAFTVLQAGDLVVTGALGEGVTTYVLGVDYTLSGVGTNAGSVNFFSPPANNTVITAYRSTPLVRNTDYQENGDLRAGVLNTDVDRIWLVLQEIIAGSQVAPNVLRVPSGEVVPVLARAALRANKLLGFDSFGRPIATLPQPGDATGLALSLASTTSAGQGGGQVGHNWAINYPDGSISGELEKVLGDGAIDYRRVVTDVNANNRAAIYGASGQIYIPAGVTVRCNLLPTDDVRKFTGEGNVLSTDPWGTSHTLNLKLMRDGPSFTPRQLINQAVRGFFTVTLGCIGDSITDGAFGGVFTSPQPIDGSGNLNSTNYNHNLNGGQNSWFRTFVDGVCMLAGSTPAHVRTPVVGYNAARSGQKLSDGWAYRNFDYGFFQNQAYDKAAPGILMVTMGTNDVDAVTSVANWADYVDKVDALIRKAWGYGCTVGFASMTHWQGKAGVFYEALLAHIQQRYPKVDFLDLALQLRNLNNAGTGNFATSSAKDPAEGGGYDLLHPETLGHRFLGGAAAVAMMPSKVAAIRPGMNWLPAQTAAAIAYSNSIDEIQPAGFSVSDNWLSPETAWPGYQPPSNETMSIRQFFWVDDDDVEMHIVEPKAPGYSVVSSYANTVRIYGPDLRDGAASASLASSGLSTFTGYKVTGCGLLARGLNVVEVEYTQPATVYAPLIQFRRARYETAIGPTSRLLAALEVSRIAHNAGVAPIYQMSFNGGTAFDELPDANRSQSSPCLMSVTVRKCDVSAGVIGFWKQHLGSGVAVVQISSTQVAIALVTSGTSGAALTTLTGDYSGAWTANFLQSGTCTVTVIDSAGSAQTYNLATPRTGGGVGLINTASAGARRVTVSGASMTTGRASPGVTGA